MEKDNKIQMKTIPYQIPAKKQELEVIKNPTSFKLNIPEEVESKIRHLCSRVSTVEWSGTLFYTVKGSLDDGSFEITCLDICVMDIGTSSFTEFKDSEEIIAYRLEHKETLLEEGVYEGLIHSHNRMPAFFSSTDTNTLREEGTDLNHFLSLVVCNAGQYVARITRKIKVKAKIETITSTIESREYNTFENAVIILADGKENISTSTKEIDKSYIEYFDLTINKTEVPNKFKELDARLDELSKKPLVSPNYSQSTKSYYPIKQVFNGSPSRQLVLPFEKTNTESQNSTPSLNFPRVTQRFEMEEIDDSVEALEEYLDDFEFWKTETVPLEIVKNLCAQLLTGSIFAVSANLDLENWVKKMDKRFENRFGNLQSKETLMRISSWADMFIQELLGYSVNQEFEDKLMQEAGIDEYSYDDDDAFKHLYACDMISFLDNLPDSIVKNILIKSLIYLMPEEYEEYTRNTELK